LIHISQGCLHLLQRPNQWKNASSVHGPNPHCSSHPRL
jgi:hypothetical protein